MKVNWNKLLVTGLKVVSALAAGVAVFFGIGKVVGSENKEERNETSENFERNNDNSGNGCPSNSTDSTDGSKQSNKLQTVVGSIKVVQTVCTNVVNIIGSLAGVAKSFNNLFSKQQYQVAMNQPIDGQMPEGNYPWNPVEDSMPYNTPVNMGCGVYAVKRPDVIEVW